MKELHIQMTKCLLVLTEVELQSLLARDPELWDRAIDRGKSYKRRQNYISREYKLPKDDTFEIPEYF